MCFPMYHVVDISLRPETNIAAQWLWARCSEHIFGSLSIRLKRLRSKQWGPFEVDV